MRFDIVTGFPALVAGPLNESMIRKAQEKGLVQIHVHDLRDYADDRHKTIDDAPFGGGSGMVMKPEPVFRCIETLLAERVYDDVIYMSADGERFEQATANRLSLKENLIVLCGHYKGIDQRIRDVLVTMEVSLGDYVLTGGELPALVFVDALIRLVPGVVNDAESVLSDSFQDKLLGAPEYTRPAEFRGMRVPEVLVSGNHEQIARWREEQQRERTGKRRNDLLEIS